MGGQLVAVAQGVVVEHVLHACDLGHGPSPDIRVKGGRVGERGLHAGDLADGCGISETADGAVVSGYLGADCRQYATDELMELLAHNEIPAGRVNTRAEVVDDPQVQATGILRDVEHPRGGAMQPRSAAAAAHGILRAAAGCSR